MGRPKGPAKDPFADLSVEFKDAIVGSTVEEINKRIAELAKNEEENKSTMKLDQDLTEKKEAVKFASESYREATKAYKLAMSYIMQVLGDKGKV